MKIVLRIPLPTPSLNKFTFRNWRVQHEAKKKWSVMMLVAIRNSENWQNFQAQGKRRVTVERFGKRKLDLDNFVGGLKGVVIDNLRAHGLLVDDNSNFVELYFSQPDLPKKTLPFTVITLEDL